MVKLTPELIEQCAQFTNPVRDRELDLRGKYFLLPVQRTIEVKLNNYYVGDILLSRKSF